MTNSLRQGPVLPLLHGIPLQTRVGRTNRKERDGRGDRSLHNGFGVGKGAGGLLVGLGGSRPDVWSVQRRAHWVGR